MPFEKEKNELRKVYASLLIETAKKDDRIVVVEADLMNANGTTGFLKEFPDRTFDVGVAEANMIGVAAGLAACGKLPFANSFTAFSTRRCYDQITISVAYANLPVRVVGTDPGICAELNGGTHMSLEDMAIMRSMANMTVFEPTDGAQLEAAWPHILAYKGPIYIRLMRKNAASIFAGRPNYKDEFALGKADVLRDGSDVAIFASGIMVEGALEAAAALEAEGLSAAVINVHTLKPIDAETVTAYAKKCGAVVTAENHSVVGALGSAVAEVTAEHCPVPLRRVGVKDHFGEVGALSYLAKKFGMLPSDIAAAAKEAVSLKK